MKLKRILCTVLAAVLLLGVLPLTALASQWGEGDTLENALAQFKVGFSDTQLDWLALPSLGVIKLRYTYYMFKNERTGTIDAQPVYCIDPTRGGAYEIVRDIGPNSDGSKTATYIKGEKVGDPRYRAILESGYPHVRFEGLGLKSLEEAYYATKIALWMYVRGNNANNLTINPAYGNSDPVATRVRDAAIFIYERGMKVTTADSKLTMTGKTATANLDNNGDYYVQIIDVLASHWIGTNPDASGDVTLSWGSQPPSGTVVLGTNGEDITSSLILKMTGTGTGSYKGQVTVMYPASAIDPNMFSPPTLKAEAILPNNDIYIAYAEAGKDKYQRYLVERDPKTTLTAAIISQISWESIPEEVPKDSGLRIRKVQAGTNIPLEGAVFEIRDPQGRLIYSLTTNSQGIIDVPLFEEGNHTVTETVPPIYHTLPERRTQSVYAHEGETAEVTFTDTPYGALRVVKRDANDGRPLAGACVRIRNIVTNTTQEAYTDSSGSVYFDKLPCGAYEIKEITAPNGYALDSSVHTVNVVPMSEGETSYVLTDKAKPGLRIVKFDRQKMTPIAGVTFEVWKDGELYGTYVTNDWGEIELLNLPAGTYLAREIAAPAPYVVDKTAQWIELKAGQGYIAELIFFNLTKPGIRLQKVDSESLAALTGAVYKIKKVGGSFEKEFTTDANGEIDLKELEPGAYQIIEVKAPAGYLIDDAVRTMQINAGESACFVFTDTKKPSLELLKYDPVNNKNLAGATFRIAKIEDGSRYLDRVTDQNGRIRVDDLDPGVYSVKEIAAPSGYILNETEYHVQLFPGKTSTIVVENIKKPSLIIKKYDMETAKPLPDTEFSVSKKGGAVIYEGLTNGDGFIRLDDLDEGWVTVTEMAPPPGYLNSNPVSRDVYLEGGKVVEVKFDNLRCPTLTIEKRDSMPGAPIPNVKFNVKFSPAVNFTGGVVDLGNYLTDSAGRIVLDNDLQSGWYRVTEIEPAPGYTMKEPVTQDIFLKGGDNKMLYFENIPKSALVIRKIDSATGLPVNGATFEVRYLSGTSGSGGTLIKTAVTSVNGTIVLTSLNPGTYVVSEVRAAPGYQLSNPSTQTAYISGKEQDVIELVFTNPKMGHLVITKLDSVTRQPIAGVTFLVTDSSGAVIGPNNGEYTTDPSGVIEITEYLPIGSTVNVKEIRVPDSYNMDAAPQSIKIMENTTHRLTFYNSPKSGIQIVKIDADTKQPLKGAVFSIYKKSGDLIGEYETDAEGLIILDKLNPGWIKIVETRAPEGYLLDDTPKDIEITNNQFVKVVFENRRISGLQIKKIDSVTRQPIENVEFSIAKMNGERIGTYKTDKSGLIYASLVPGWYVVTEVKTASGYMLDSAPRNVEVKTGAPVVLEIENTPMSGLTIIKTDANTGKVLKGVIFDVRRADGQLVSGNILDGNQPGTTNNSPNRSTSPNGDISGSYTTDANGRIQINGLAAGEYHVVERKQLPGYELDTEVYSVTVTPGKMATLQLTNKPLGGIRLVKIDSLTKKGIYNVEFMVFDGYNKVVGTFYTDNNGVIDFAGILPEGRYTIRETRPAANYYNDDIPRTVEFKAGYVTEIRWENVPKMGQIQILKKSGDDNEVNGLPAGMPLAGAIFEIYEYKSGNLVDRMISGNDGRAVSKPLPLGRYLVKEVQAPQWYKLSTQTLDIDVEFATQIVKMEYLNYSANTGVYIKKTGPAECMPGDTIRYDIKAVQNTSTVPLTDFYWRDPLPTNAVRLTKIVTGTYNQSLKYKIMITTNKGNTRVIADNLSTTKNNVIDCSNASLGLKSDEYVTSFTLLFGTVKAGFAQVEQPQIFVKTLTTLPNGYEFANKADVGGKHGKEWIISNSTTLCKIYRKPQPLPRTGF